METITLQPNEIELTVTPQETLLTAQTTINAVTVPPSVPNVTAEPQNVAVNVQPNEVSLNVLTGATINNYGTANIVVGEIPNGTINGSNATFTTDYDFTPESVLVFRNGLAQYNPTHYTTSGTTTISLNFSPIVGDVITVNYTRA